VAARTVQAQAREAGVAWRTVQRAKADLGVLVDRIGERGRRGGGSWKWYLPLAP
jgi:hypothetical protein